MAQAPSVNFLSRDYDVRERLRRALCLRSVITINDRPHEVWIHDMSESGMLLESSRPPAVGTIVTVDLPEVGATPARIVWRNGSYTGCEFSHPISKPALSAAKLASTHLVPNLPQASERVTAPHSSNTVVSWNRATKLAVIGGAGITGWAIILGSLSALFPN